MSLKKDKNAKVPKRFAFIKSGSYLLERVSSFKRNIERYNKESQKSNAFPVKPQVKKLKKKIKSSDSGTVTVMRSVRLKLTSTTLIQFPVTIKVKSQKKTVPYSPSKIVECVRNIDAGDEDSPDSVSTYVNDIYDYLYQLELDHPVKKHHLRKQLQITPYLRATLLDFVNETHADFRLVQETYFQAVNIIDQYLQNTTKLIKSENLQLLGVTSLFIAAKYEELIPPLLKHLVRATNNHCRKSQILKMELSIVKTLDCQLSRPLPIYFLRRFAKAADADDVLCTTAEYFLELATIECALASCRPSEIAAAALLLALHIREHNPNKARGFDSQLWNKTLQHYSHYSAMHLRSIVCNIADIVRWIPTSELQAIYKKYQLPENFMVSSLPRLYGALMDSIADDV